MFRKCRLALASYVRGGVQQTDPSARLGHTPPGFTNGRQRQTGSEIDSGSKTSEQRANARESCDLRSNNFRETGPVLGKGAQNLCVSSQSYFSQTYRFRATGPNADTHWALCCTLIGPVAGNERPTIADYGIVMFVCVMTLIQIRIGHCARTLIGTVAG